MFFLERKPVRFPHSFSDKEHQEILHEIGHGVSLVSVHDLHGFHEKYSSIDPTDPVPTPSMIKAEKVEQPIVKSIDKDEMPIELTEEEKYLFDKLSQNQQRIQMQHQQLLIKATKFLSNAFNEGTILL